MKIYNVTAHIPEVASPYAFQCATVKAGDFGLAAKRAWSVIRKRDGVARKKMRVVKLSIVEVPTAPEDLRK